MSHQPHAAPADTIAQRFARRGRGRIALGVAIGALVAVVADLVLLAVVEGVFAVVPEVPLQPGSALVALGALEVTYGVVPAAIGAGIVYAIVSRRFARPARSFLIVATVVLFLSLGGVASLPISPAEQVTLVAIHVVSAALIVGAVLLLAARA